MKFLEETIACWIAQPRIVVRASHAGLEVDKFPGNFLWCQSTCVWYPASWLSVLVDWTLLSPWLEVLDFAGSFRVLHPLNDLCHCYEINVIVVGKNFVDPVKESIKELGVVFQPSSVEIKTEWGTVCVVMTFEIVVEESVELIT